MDTAIGGYYNTRDALGVRHGLDLRRAYLEVHRKVRIVFWRHNDLCNGAEFTWVYTIDEWNRSFLHCPNAMPKSRDE